MNDDDPEAPLIVKDMEAVKFEISGEVVVVHWARISDRLLTTDEQRELYEYLRKRYDL